MTRSLKRYFNHLFIIYYITYDYKFIIVVTIFDFKSNHIKFTLQKYKINSQIIGQKQKSLNFDMCVCLYKRGVME